MFSLVDVLADFSILGGIVIYLSSTLVDVFSFPASILYKSVAGQCRPAIDLM